MTDTSSTQSLKHLGPLGTDRPRHLSCRLPDRICGLHTLKFDGRSSESGSVPCARREVRVREPDS